MHPLNSVCVDLLGTGCNGCRDEAMFILVFCVFTVNQEVDMNISNCGGRKIELISCHDENTRERLV